MPKKPSVILLKPQDAFVPLDPALAQNRELNNGVAENGVMNTETNSEPVNGTANFGYIPYTPLEASSTFKRSVDYSGWLLFASSKCSYLF